MLALAAGAIAACLLPALPVWPAWFAGLGLAAGLVAWPRSRLAGLFLLGALWLTGHAQWQLDRDWPEARGGEIVEISGRVASLPETRGGRTRFVLVTDRASRAEGAPARVLLNWYWPREYFQPGERWRLEARLDPPAGRSNPGGFDYRRFLLAQRIGATGEIRSARRLDAGGAFSALDRARQRTGEWLQAETIDLDAAALHRALTVADRSAMDPELSGLLRRTGTAHLLAISGLHVGMVAGLCAALAGLLVSPLLPLIPGLERRRVALVAGLAGAAGYAALAGFSLPTQRALVMLAVAFGAVILRRGIRPGHALLVALAAVLVLDPLAPLSTGFWLSFGAVAVLVWTFAWRPGQGGWLSGLVRAQALIAVGLLPLNAGVFQQMVPVALAANLAAIPLVGFWILPALLAGLALFLAGLPGAAGAVALAEAGVGVLLGLLAQLDGLPLGHRGTGGGGPLAIALAMAGALWLLAPRGWPLRWAGAVLLVPLLWPAGQRPAPGGFEAWLADTGDGLAVVVRTRTETLLYDTGPGDGGERHGVDSTLVPLMRAIGARGIDRLVVSHARLAHAGGVEGVLGRFDPPAVFSPGGRWGEPCRAGQQWQADGVEFRVLHPSPALPDLGPDSSCVLEVSAGALRMVLAGGAGPAVQRRLVQLGRARPAGVVVLPRGGHRAALEPDWLARLEPDWALASAAAHSRRGLPHPEVEAAVEAAGARLVSTGRCGAVRVSADPGAGFRVESTARLERRFWRAAGDCP